MALHYEILTGYSFLILSARLAPFPITSDMVVAFKTRQRRAHDAAVLHLWTDITHSGQNAAGQCLLHDSWAAEKVWQRKLAR